MYRNKILIDRTIITQGPLKQDIESNERYGSYWGMVKTSRDFNRFQNDVEATEKQRRFVIKYAKSLDEFLDSEKTQFTLVHRGIRYEVKEAINDNDLNDTVTIYCESVI